MIWAGAPEYSDHNRPLRDTGRQFVSGIQFADPGGSPNTAGRVPTARR
jgi:hypothetical protein